MKLHRIAVLLLSASVLFACGGKEDNGGGGGTTVKPSTKDPTVFNTNIAGTSFSPENQTTTFTVSCDVAWSAKPDVDWLSVSPSSGKGNTDGEEVTVTIRMNTANASRSGSITLTAGKQTRKVNINQKPITEMIKETEVVLTKKETYKLVIETTGTWKAELVDNVDWVHIEPKSGSGRVSMYIQPQDENENVGDRTTKLRFTMGSDHYDLPLRHRQKNALLVKTEDILITYDAQNVQIPVETNIDFTVDTGEAASWLHFKETKALNSKTVTLFADAYDGPAPRQATVVFTNSDDISESLIVKQWPYNPAMEQTIPGVYSFENQDYTLYTEKWQVSVLKKDQDLSFRLLNPTDVSVVSLAGLTQSVKWGDALECKLIVSLSGSQVYSDFIKAYVVKVDDSNIWLSLENGTGVIVKK